MTTAPDTKAIEFTKECDSRIWAKKDFQKMLKAVKKQGLEVTKINSGYLVHLKDELMIKAMNGNHGYLVRSVKNLFES